MKIICILLKMIDDIVNNSKKYLQTIHNQSEYFGGELLQPLTVSHEGKLEPVGNLIKGGMHSVSTSSIDELIQRSNVKWIAHTHLETNLCPSEDDLKILFQYNHNYNTSISHIIIDKEYIWVIHSQKKYYYNVEKSVKSDVDEYSEYLKLYKTNENIEEFINNCKKINVNVYRFSIEVLITV